VSNYLAVATVTATLQHLLQPAIQAAVPGAQVRTLRPDLMVADRSALGVNVFLYQVHPNATHRNDDLPTRTSDATLRVRPRAAIDLSYLISCLGSDEAFEPQRLLGATVATLHAWPVLTPPQIEAVVAADPTILGGSDVAQQVESIEITLDGFTREELSRLWTMFGTAPYNLSVGYRVSVVLLEPDLMPLAVQPIQQVHPTVMVSDDPAATLASLTPAVTS
jgi:uncharacterized protein DUF4255